MSVVEAIAELFFFTEKMSKFVFHFDALRGNVSQKAAQIYKLMTILICYFQKSIGQN